jgi:hypothetical protein
MSDLLKVWGCWGFSCFPGRGWQIKHVIQRRRASIRHHPHLISSELGIF